MQQRKKIYKRALKKLEKRIFICGSIYLETNRLGELCEDVVVDFPEFMLFKPDNLTVEHSWFDNQLEREICLDFCILFCNEKLFDNA